MISDVDYLTKENLNLKLEQDRSKQLIADLTLKLKDNELEKEKLKVKLDEQCKLNKKMRDDLDLNTKSDGTAKVEKKLQQIYYERQLAKHREELKDLDNKYANKIFNLKKRNYFLNEEISNLKLERTKATNNIIQKSRCVTRLTKERDDLKEEVNKLKETQVKSLDEMKLSEEDHFKLKSIKILEDLYEKLKRDHEVKVKECADLNEKCVHLTLVNLSLETRIDQLDKEVQELRTRDSFKEQLDELNVRLCDKESVNVLLQNEKKILLTKCNTYKQQIKELENELTNLKSNKNNSNEFMQLGNANLNKPPTVPPKVTLTISRFEVIHKF